MTDQLDRLKAALTDRYTIEREIGSGGMATVYLAEDLKHHRQVAIKVLHPQYADNPDYRQRFDREASLGLARWALRDRRPTSPAARARRRGTSRPRNDERRRRAGDLDLSV